MAKLFTRMSKDIAIAVREGGSDPAANSTLRRVLQTARAKNMPKDKIEAAMKRALGKDTAKYETVIYEGYAPHGIAVIVEAATDNATRTVANVRMHMKQAGGNLGTSGSVLFHFEHMGIFRVPAEKVNVDAMELALIDRGLADLGNTIGDNGEQLLELRCAFPAFGTMHSAIEASKLGEVTAEAQYIPKALVELGGPEGQAVLKMVDALERDEDVQRVFHNLA